MNFLKILVAIGALLLFEGILAAGVVLPCASEDIESLGLLGNTEVYEFTVDAGQSICATSRTRECSDDPLSATHWQFKPTPATSGSYVLTPAVVSPLNVCVLMESGVQSLLVRLPANDSLGEGKFAIEFSPVDVPNTSVELQISHFPHGFTSESAFFTIGDEGLRNVWKSYGVCQTEVHLCEWNGSHLVQPSDLFQPPVDELTNECDQKPPSSYGLRLNRPVSPEDSHNYTIVLVEGDCNLPRVTSDPITLFVVYTEQPSPQPTSTPQPTADSSSDGPNIGAIVGGVVGGFVVVSFIVALFVLAGVAVRRCRGSKVDGAPEEGVDKPGKSPPPLARSPSEHNNYWHMPGRVVQEEAIEMSPSVKLLEVSATEPSSNFPETNLRTVAVVTSGGGKESEALGDNIVRRHERCERQEVQLAGHSADLQEYICRVLSHPSLDWFYVIWHGSLEKLRRDDNSAPVSLWRLVSELKSFVLPEDQRRKVVLVQLGALSTTDHRNGLLTLYIKLPEGDCSEAQMADLVFSQMENRDRQRRKEREGSLEVPNDLPATKDRSLLRFLHIGGGQKSQSQSAPTRRKGDPRVQQLATNGVSKSASGSTREIADPPPVEGDGVPKAPAKAEDGKEVVLLGKIYGELKEQTEASKLRNKLMKEQQELQRQTLEEQKRTTGAVGGFAEDTQEILDLQHQQIKRTDEGTYVPDGMVP